RFGKGLDRILVVDDDKDFVRLLTRLLDDPVRRYQVQGAYTGQEALELMGRWQPDLLLLDLALPDIQGAEIMQKLERDPDLCDIPIVVVSGKEGESNDKNLKGALKVTRVSGLRTAEVVGWVQETLDSVACDGVEEEQMPAEEEAIVAK
ncbi:MAG: response regulator, partial [Anaerolineales bacterium]